jgi:tetraacyldisaccharide 4'-kinase
MHMRQLWESDAFGPRIARAALVPASALYGFGWEAYLAMYRLSLKHEQAPHHPVMCVGNLTVGGSGKTPVTLHIARVLRDMGREVVIGTSGYGAPHSVGATLAPNGRISAREWGDEPAMFRWLAPEFPLVVGRGRVLAATRVHERHPSAVLLMDDGFQHLPLHKDLQILLEEDNPVNRRCLPAGPYREPPRNRNRADLVLPGPYQVVEEPLRFALPSGTIAEAPKSYAVLCALGRPNRFIEALQSALEAAPNPTVTLPDHDPLSAGTLWARLPDDRPVVVTAKDWVKLRERPDVGTRRVVIALQSVRIEPAAEFRAWIGERLDGKAP